MSRKRPLRLVGEKIGLFGKGGAGKSTVAVLLARALRNIGYGVVLLDADSTNVGISAALGVDGPPQTLIDYFGGMVFSGGSVTCPVDDPTPLRGADLDLARLPALLVARSPEGIRIVEAGKIGHRGPGAGCDGPIAKIARDVRIHGESEEPVTLVDFKAGFEDSARGVLTGLDRAIVVVDPTRAAVQIAADMQDMLRQIRSGALPATHHLERPHLVETAHGLYRRSRIKGLHCVLNRIPDEASERFLRERLAGHGIEPIGVIHERRSIADSWLRGRELDVEAAQDEARIVARRLEATAGDDRGAEEDRATEDGVRRGVPPRPA